ncbi:class I adenylate cyclase [Rodentibacter caecimuris]|uniref:class I adenylate cyclase n=1 Tax=Rodentibacter caecimuris TaxID=1796644 RepID=UPI0010945072|nr:class I adenylate cyclase [Pasteurella caecimuris]MCR1837052.1 class I adenylate cyclase [Pasteurella caecimuris]MCU0106758.1 class I adenylate cyclase [Pasteurella caecimuris]TGY50291.1 class I adenylate cyclase [Pasteurella caecimuris]
MKYDLDRAKKCVEILDKRRLERALSGSGDGFRHVLSLFPLLFQLNHSSLSGYVAQSPCGVANFKLSAYQQQFLSSESPELYEQIKDPTYGDNPPILGIYVMGSFGSISQSSSSDMDTWICCREDLTENERDLLEQKAQKIKEWAMGFEVEINFYLVDQQRFRHGYYSEPLTSENSGSAQYMLLLDEFYRSAVRLAGKPLLWLHLWVENEADYENEVKTRIQNGSLDSQDWVDFGGLAQFSAKEYFGAGLWQLYKGIDSPYKSVLKILLLEVYSKEYPNPHLIARQFKEDLFSGNTTPAHHFDPYIAILSKVTDYLTALSEFKRLDFVRRCFYVKVTEDLALYQTHNWRTDYIQILAQEWGWSAEQIHELNYRPFWKIKRAKESHDNLVKFLMMSYHNLVSFARKYKINSSVVPQDINVLTRKLYTTFEELPGKVILLNSQISRNLSEPHISFLEVRGNKHFQDGWYLINRAPNTMMFSQHRIIEYNKSLNKLVAWAYFNRLLTAETQLHLFSRTIEIETLRNFVADLRLSFSRENSVAGGDILATACEIRNIVIAVNLTSDPTARITEFKDSLSACDLFSFGSLEQNLVGSIDFTYRNIWNEIRTLHFEGPNAILIALKVLSNKIYRDANNPPSVQVFCYSRHYRRTLRNLVSALVNRCINIQLGNQTFNIPRLRVAGKNWQFFFEESGLSLQEVENSSQSAVDFDDVLQSPVEEKSDIYSKHRKYPIEIDLLAREGFLQFFFEDNKDNTFNVYLLNETNQLEIYRHCDGSKDEKVQQINQLYQALESGDENPYHIESRNFNYPQFYQIQYSDQGDVQIQSFKYQQHVSAVH